MRKSILSLSCFLLLSLSAFSQGVINLSGRWDFSMGPDPRYADSISLPASMLTAGKGLDVSLETPWVGSIYDSSFYFNPYLEAFRQEGNLKFPFFLTPEKHYVGPAWYAKTVSVPKNWKDSRIILFLERPHIETTIMVNGQVAGRDSSLSVPHQFDITDLVRPGKANRIEVLVYNGIENVCVGQDSHSVTDQTQGNWNGIVGRIELRRKPLAYIDNVQIYPDTEKRELRLSLELVDHRKNASAPIEAQIGVETLQTFSLEKNADGRASITIPMPDDMKLWDEFEPNVYDLLTIVEGDTLRTMFGVRDFRIEGRQFYINGRKTWLRGTVENCCFPLTGYPPTSEEEWMSVMRKCKEYGFNMIRFHSYCPPEAAFIAADKTGIYLQPEGPSWPNHGVKLRRGMTIDRYLLEETQRMVKAYGNHPSFCMLAASNEPAGDWVAWAGDFVDYWHQTGDNRRVYCGASVGGGWAFDPKSDYHVKGGAKGLTWTMSAPQSTDTHEQAITHFTQKSRSGNLEFDINEPYVCHELGQWCAFPDLDERSQYTGPYKAYNFDIFAHMLETNGMASQARNFLMASGKLQMLAYKYDIERNLRTPDYAGFHMLSINDYSGQGTALVGPLNVFWREKAYCTPEAWREFCGPIVPLAKFPKFVFSNEDTLNVEIELYNASAGRATTVGRPYEPGRGSSPEEPAPAAARPYATITRGSGDLVFRAELAGDECLPVGKNVPLGSVSLPLDRFDEAEALTLTVWCDEGAHNSWHFFVYPAKAAVPAAADIYISDTLDERATAVLRTGGKVLIEAAGRVSLGSDVKQEYLPVFWNTSWFKMRPPHTTGAYIDTSHPLFSHYFKTDYWADLNWWELLNGAQVMNLLEMPVDYQSPVQPIDTWHVSRKLGMIVEANVLGGRLLITTMDLRSDPARRLVAQDMRRAILEYMQSEDFRPAITLDAETIGHFFTRQAPKVDMFTNDSPDELKPAL